jgi:hypothetical protein
MKLLVFVLLLLAGCCHHETRIIGSGPEYKSLPNGNAAPRSLNSTAYVKDHGQRTLRIADHFLPERLERGVETMDADLFGNMVKALESFSNTGKPCIRLNNRAIGHINWLIANGHMTKDNVSIEALMDADKKLGITPLDWDRYA